MASIFKRRSSTSKSKASLTSEGGDKSVCCHCCQSTKRTRFPRVFSKKQFEKCGACSSITCDRCLRKASTCHKCRIRLNFLWNNQEALQAINKKELQKLARKLHFDKKKVKSWEETELITQILRHCNIPQEEEINDPFVTMRKSTVEPSDLVDVNICGAQDFARQSLMMPQNQTRLDKDGKTSDERQQTTKRVENVTHIAEPRSERTRGHSSTKGAEASSQSLISASQQYENMPQAHRRYSNDKEYRDSKLMMVHEEPEESTESVNDYRPQSIDISEVSFMSHSALQEVPVNIREMDSSDNQKVKRPSNIGRRPRVSSTDHNTDEVLSQYHSIDENKDLNAPGTNNATTGEEKPRRSIQRPKSLPPETPVRTSSLPRNARTSLELDQEERLRDSDHQELLNEPIVSKVTTNMQPLRLVSHMMDKTSIEDESKLEIQAQFQDTEISQKLQQVVYPQEEDVTVQNLTNFLEKREVNLMEGDEVREPEQLELAQISRDKRDNVYEMQLEKNLGGEEIIETLKDAKQQQPKSPENHYSLVEQVPEADTSSNESSSTDEVVQVLPLNQDTTAETSEVLSQRQSDRDVGTQEKEAFVCPSDLQSDSRDATEEFRENNDKADEVGHYGNGLNEEDTRRLISSLDQQSYSPDTNEEFHEDHGMMVEVPEMLLTLGEIPRVTDERSPSSHSREGLKRLDGEDNSVNQLSLPVEIISGTVIMNSDENTIQLLSNEEQLIHADDDATKATREMRELLVVAEEEEEEEEEWFGSTTEEESEMKESVRSSAPTTDDDRTFKIYTISTTNGQHDSSKQLSQESKTTKDNMSSNECEHRPTMDDIREDHRDKNDGSAEASLSRASPLAEVFEQVGIKSKRHVHIQSTKILRELLETQGVRLEASVPREVVVTSVVTLWENHKK